MKTGVIYARYSSDKQTEQSIEGQVQVCLDYAKGKDIQIIHIYADRALSGMTDDRPEFLKMIGDSSQKKFNYVIVYKLDRFARNKHDSVVYTEILRKNGVTRLSATENLPENYYGVYYESLLEANAEFYSLELSEKVKRGIKLTLQKGKSIGAITPYGYDSVDGYYRINQIEAKVVNMIYDMYLNNIPVTQIRKELNANGIYNKKGNAFLNNQIYAILKNLKYTGIYIHYGVEYNNIYPCIIKKDKFDQVQEQLSSRRRTRVSKNKDDAIYYLSGKMFYDTGYKLIPFQGTSGNNRYGKTYRYYQTNKTVKHLKSRITIRKDLIEATVAKMVIERILTKDEIGDIIDDIVKVYNEELKDDSQIKQLRQNRNRVKREIKNLIDAVKKGIISDTLNFELSELESQLAEIKIAISNEELKKPLLSKTGVLFLFEKLKKNSNDTQYQAILLNNFVKSVVISENDTITIVCNLKPNNPYKFTEKDLKGSDSISQGSPLSSYPNYRIHKYHLIVIDIFYLSDLKRR